MNNKSLTKVALRYRAVFLDTERTGIDMEPSAASVPVMAFIARLAENGFCVSEELLHALHTVTADRLAEITACVNDVMGVTLNWAPLVKGWDIPTNETLLDHFVTLLANFFGEEAVTWYRVRGAPDKLTDGASADDERMGTGYSLTIDQSFKGTGDYYASVDVSSSPSGVLCTDLMRSLIVHYASTTPAAAPPLLEPTVVRPNEAQRLLRLNPNAPTTVTIYDIAGHRLQTLSADGVERMSLQAEGVAGCYQVVVQNGDQRTVLRYIVIK